MGLNKDEKKEIIELARISIEKAVKGGKLKDYEPKNSKLLEKRGAFVTLKKQGNLRGCIGYVLPEKPLFQTIIDAAESSALSDPRFPPVSEDEIENLEFEISVLTIPKKIDNIEEIQVGKHGIILEKGFYKGLLLPQVATEYGWDRKTFLEHTALKAGLNKKEWKNADIKVFSAEVFSEKDI